MKSISPTEAKALLDQGWTYLDVRSEQEFERAHPAGAVNVPLLHMGQGGMRPNPDFLRVVEAAFPKDARLVVGCQAGGRSAKAVELLQSRGFTNLVDQRCGFGGARDAATGQVEPGWAALNLPVEAGAPEGRSYQALLHKPT